MKTLSGPTKVQVNKASRSRSVTAIKMIRGGGSSARPHPLYQPCPLINRNTHAQHDTERECILLQRCWSLAML